MYVLAYGAAVLRTPTPADALLRALPAGAYTTARTTRGRAAVFELEAHVERTAASARLMAAAEGRADAAGLDAAALRPAFVAGARRAVAAYEAAFAPAAAVELKLTTLLLWGPDRVGAAAATLVALGAPPLPAPAPAPLPALMVLTHAAALAPRRAPPIVVVVAGAPRHNAAAKDSAWVSERAALEAHKARAVEEVLLLDAAGRLLEGTQTNFFAVSAAGVVQTADVDVVLAGTVRGLVLLVCRAAGIPVELAPPRLADAASWQGAFLTSTSRLVLPIDELQPSLQPAAAAADGAAPAPPAPPPVCFAPSPLVSRIEALVAAQVDAHSTALALADAPS